MSFCKYKNVIEENDTVILYLTVSQVYCITANEKTISKKGHQVDNVLQTTFGALKCKDLIGQRYGSKILLSKGWGYAMQPTPELWTLTLPHRTQIIYTADISTIILKLDISPGCTVVESGTGSGSISHAFIRTIQPNGKLYTFDFHEGRVDVAKNEFEQHGISSCVTVMQRDVCVNGFGDSVMGQADAVFLDLPHPWQAVPHALNCFKASGGRICSFSPCIEQVQKMCQALSLNGFRDIETMEILQTCYSVQMKNLNVFNLDYLKNKKDGTEIKGQNKEITKCYAAVRPDKIPGHTGYLTFATLLPNKIRNMYNDIVLQDDDENDSS